MARPKGTKNKKLGNAPVSTVTITVKILGRYYTVSGSTFTEAFNKLEVGKARGASVWKVEQDGRTREKIVGMAVTSQLFNTGGLSREIALSRFLTLFT